MFSASEKSQVMAFRGINAKNALAFPIRWTGWLDEAATRRKKNQK
jgi:hypothetical protein